MVLVGFDPDTGEHEAWARRRWCHRARRGDRVSQRRQRALRALESWLVRRMMLGATTQHYNRLLASLLTTLHEQDDLSAADDAILTALRGFENPTDLWPADEEISRRLLHDPLYGWINQRRIRVLLEACEQQMADNNLTEQLLLPEKLTIEHALPQSWHDNWAPEPRLDEDPADAVERREAHKHLLGNLTLVTRGLNSALSNAAWATKRLELAQRSQLLVNQRLCAHDVWNEDMIDERGSELTGYILATWPGPRSAGWDTTD
jgi:Protein of unknown function (DUF1524)